MGQVTFKVWLAKRWEQKVLRQLIKQHTHELETQLNLGITTNHENKT